MHQKLLQEIIQIHGHSKQRYGSPNITKELEKKGYRVSRPLVARIMREEGIRSITHRKFRVCTTDSRHSFPISPNLLNRNFKAGGPGEKWVSDITYIPTKGGWVYLTVIIDLYDRKVIGWSISTGMKTRETIIPALRMALVNRKIMNGQLIFHSDRGVQYASNEFRAELKNKQINQSMSRKGDCWDNAVAENFFRMLKTEMVNHENYHSILEARVSLFEYIESWYNRKRNHQYLGYRSPDEFMKIELLKYA